MSYALIIASRVDGEYDTPPTDGCAIVQCLGCNDDVWLEPGPAEQASERQVDAVVVACTPCFVRENDAINAERAEAASTL